MKKVFFVMAVLGLLCMSITAQANIYTWNFTNAGDYTVGGDPSLLPVINAASSGGSAYFAPRPYNPADPDDVAYGSDWASLFARINTQAPSLRVGDITGGGFTINGFASQTGTPSSIFDTIRLSPTGGDGSTVLILLSPMTYTGTGTLNYTFDLNTHADYRTDPTGLGNWSAYDAAKSGTFGQVIGMLSAYTGYAAFVGPEIGMSGTNATTFTLTQIELDTVPEPATMLLLGLGLMGIAGIRRKLRS
jgi:hypothetical protein